MSKLEIMETVTINLDTYNSMKDELEILRKKNTPKVEYVEVIPHKYEVLYRVCAALFGIGLFLDFFKIIHY